MSSIFSTYRGLPRSMYIVFLAQIINRFGDFVRPFLTLFLTKNLGFTNSAAGAAIMAVTLATIPGAFIGGKLSDQIGRKESYILFQGTAGFLILACAFISRPSILVGLLVLSAFFNGGVRPMISALMTDILPPEKRPSGFSLSYLGVNIGVAAGPIVAGFLFNNHLKWLFIGDAVTTAIAVLLVMTLIEVPKKEDVMTGSDLEDHEEGSIWTALIKRPFVLAFLCINILYALTYAQHSFALPLALDQLFKDDGPRNFGFLMSVNAVTCVSMTVLVTHVTRKLKPINIIALGGVAYFIGFGMIAFIDSMFMFFASTFIWTLGEIMVSITFGVYMSNRTPQNFRARFNAITTVSWALGALIGTYFIGVYMDAVSVQAVWPLVAGVAGVGAIGMALLGQLEERRLKERENGEELMDHN